MPNGNGLPCNPENRFHATREPALSRQTRRIPPAGGISDPMRSSGATKSRDFDSLSHRDSVPNTMAAQTAIEFSGPSRRSTAAEREQRDRILRFLIVCVGAWASFGVYYLATARLESGVLCGVQCLLAFFLYRAAHGEWYSFPSIAHAALGVVTAGILVDALTSGQQYSSSTWFLSCVGLVAAHLLSVRAALCWTGVAILAIIGLSFESLSLARLPIWRTDTWLDALLLQLGIAVILTAITLQSRLASCAYRSKLEFLAGELRERNRFLWLSEEVSGTGHWRLDVRSMMVTYSPQISHLFGEKAGQPVTDSLAAFLSHFASSDADELRAAIQLASRSQDFFHRDVAIPVGNDQRYVRVSGLSDAGVDGSISLVIGTLRDDTRARRVQEVLREKNHALSNLAKFDFLTGLPNRHHFHDRLRKTLARARVNDLPCALLLLDLDGFKAVNDTLGHASGDALLQRVAQRLENSLRQGDIVARLGGDEFTILLIGVRTHADIAAATERIMAVISAPFTLQGIEFVLSASVGAALCPQHARSRDDLLSFADTAMYEAKRSGGGLRIYDPQMTVNLRETRVLENRLAAALENREFYLEYQPQVDVADERIVGAEALLRWKCDDQVIGPNDFISRLESSLAISEVGEWVLRTACGAAGQWIALGWTGRLAVNISPLQFREASFRERLEAILRETNFPAAQLELEITESMLIEEIDATANRLRELKELGISISIDDFGTGYSSLGYLNHLPIDRIKIDRAFVRDFPHNDDGTLLASIVTLAHNLGFQVIAEGVETVEQRDLLVRVGCEECQGFLFSKPIPPNQFQANFVGAQSATDVAPIIDSTLPFFPPLLITQE